jgi:serine phosphatase RsbU (regulator of sigma subunit)
LNLKSKLNFWQKIANIGILPQMADADVRRAQLTNRLLLIAILMGFTYVPIFINQGAVALLIQISILLLALISLFFLLKKSKHQTVAILLCLLLITHLLIAGALIENGTGRYFLILFSILGFTVVKPFKYGVLIFIYSVLAFFFAEFAHYFIDPIAVRTIKEGELVYVINLLLIVMGCFFLIFHYKKGNILYEKNILEKKQQIESHHEALVESHKEIQESIRYAKRIQNAILPPVKVLDKLLKDYFVVYKPKDTVAGDFYWIESQAGVTYLAVADCTGHGVPGAMVSVICNSALNRAVREMKLTDTAQILDKVRELIIQEFEKSEEDVKDGMDITLCAIKGNDLQFSGANNSLWIIRDKEHISLRADKQPIGKFEFSRPFSSKNFELQKGDQVYLTTDGYPDQFGGEKGKKLKSKNMIDLLIKFNDESMPDQQAKLDAFIEEWKGDYEQVDDICVLGFRV